MSGMDHGDDTPLYDCPECGEQTVIPEEVEEDDVIKLDCPTCGNETLTYVDELCRFGRTISPHEPACYNEWDEIWERPALRVRLCDQHYDEFENPSFDDCEVDTESDDVDRGDGVETDGGESTSGMDHERRRVMVDIETVGLEVGAAIVEIGAVQFAPGGVIGETFYSSVSLTSSQEAGLSIDADTIEWWLGENPEIASEVLVGGDPLYESLIDFVAWYEEIDPHEVWANSPSFDCEMLEHAGEQVGISMPWDFYQERDVRTLDSIPHDVEREQEGTEHNALDDALYQARVASAILSELASRDGHEPGTDGGAGGE